MARNTTIEGKKCRLEGVVCYEIGKEQSYGDRNEDRMVQIKENNDSKEETQKTGYHNYQKGELGLKRSNRVKRLN